MAKMVFINLPIDDLDKSVSFYQAIGCTKNLQFSNDKAACLVWSDTITFMLLTKPFFSSFISLPIADAHKSCQVLIALSCDDKQQVDVITQAAANAGGHADVRPPQDHGFMYSRAFADPDGHIFEPMWMDAAAIQA